MATNVSLQPPTALDIHDSQASAKWKKFKLAWKNYAIVLMKFQQYCQPCKNVPFERYRFNGRTQEPGEAHDQYRTALRKLAEGCEFQTITPGEILRDRLIFGIKDDKERERLLR